MGMQLSSSGLGLWSEAPQIKHYFSIHYRAITQRERNTLNYLHKIAQDVAVNLLVSEEWQLQRANLITDVSSGEDGTMRIELPCKDPGVDAGLLALGPHQSYSMRADADHCGIGFLLEGELSQQRLKPNQSVVQSALDDNGEIMVPGSMTSFCKEEINGCLLQTAERSSILMTLTCISSEHHESDDDNKIREIFGRRKFLIR